MTTFIQARLPGQPMQRVEKFAGESRLVSIDCTGRLGQYELLVSVLDLKTDGAEVTSSKCTGGRFVELLFGPEHVPDGRPYIDHAVACVAQTNRGTLGVALEVRVYPS